MLIDSPEQLFNDLETLVKTSDAFFVAEQEYQNCYYKIYNYRLASYTDFCQPGALNARGTMFQVDEQGHYIRLVSLPFHKFFNLYESPFTMDLDLADVEYISEKRDGSLISTFMTCSGKMDIKTKGSLYSDQAIAVRKLLQTSDFSKLLNFLKVFVEANCTVNLEYTAPENRIVIGYEKPELTILSIRHESGWYLSIKDLERECRLYEIENHLIKTFTNQYKGNMEQFVKSVPEMTDNIEGFVVKLNSGILFKIKTSKYAALHKTKDAILHNRSLYEVIVNGGSDDLRSLFHSDSWCLNRINMMENHVFKIHNHLEKTVETLYKTHKHLERKPYAILMKDLTKDEPHTFGLMMTKFLGQNIDYKTFMIKNYDLYKLVMEETTSVEL